MLALLAASCSGNSNDASSATDATLDDGCDAVPASTSSLPVAGLQTFMTLASGDNDLQFIVSSRPTTVCAGGQIRLHVAVHNGGSQTVKVSPRLVITEVLPHLVLATLDPVEIPAGGDAQTQTVVTMPLLPPGFYNVFVSNGSHSGGTNVYVKASPGN